MMNEKFGLIALALIIFAPALAGAAPSIELELVASDLSAPIGMTNAGDGSGRLFITLQGGQIVIHDGNQVLAEPFLDISALTTLTGEGGLLGIAFHPNYANNGFFYVNYTNLDGNTVIARYSVSANPNIADPGSGVVLLTIVQPFGNHNGGQLQFGPDGYLYVGMGDGGGSGDPQNNAQNLLTLLGKILRIDVNSGLPYTIPPDNPFIANPDALDEIWAYGLRNPWRFSFDRFTGDMFIGDVGQARREEVNFQPASSVGGENYGWRLMEGNICFDPTIDCNDGSLTLPMLEYNHLNGDCSVTGGYRYRGTQIPGLFGLYIYGDYCSGRIWGAAADGGNIFTNELLDTSLLIAAFGEDEAGELYVAHRATPGGVIYRIVAGPSLTLISLTSPPDQSVLTSAPTLAWTADGGTNNVFAVDFAIPPTLPFWSTFDNLSLIINEPTWAMPPLIWALISSGRQVLWRVRGVDLAGAPPTVITSNEIRSFSKQ